MSRFQSAVGWVRDLLVKAPAGFRHIAALGPAATPVAAPEAAAPAPVEKLSGPPPAPAPVPRTIPSGIAVAPPAAGILPSLSGPLTMTAGEVVELCAEVSQVPPGPRVDPLATTMRLGASLTGSIPDWSVDEPRVPPRGRPWPHNSPRVPDPATIAASPVLSGAAFAASQVWTAMTATWAVQCADDAAAREAIASRFRSVAWKRRFMDDHEQWFDRNPSGDRSPHQFAVGLWFLPEVRRAALHALGWHEPLSRYYPWLTWGDELRPSAADPGYCYFRLFPDFVDLAAVATALGAYPEAHAVSAWFHEHGLAPPARFRFAENPGEIGHVLAPDEAGGTYRSLPGHPASAATLPDTMIIGADADEAALFRLRWVITAQAAYKVPVAEIPAVRRLCSTWRSVVLLSVHPTLTSAEDGSLFRVGLTGTEGRRRVPLGHVAPARVLWADVHTVADRFTAEAGTAPRALRPAAYHCAELSDFAIPTQQRPDLSFEFTPADGAAAALEMVFRVSGSALEIIADEEAAPAGVPYPAPVAAAAESDEE